MEKIIFIPNYYNFYLFRFEKNLLGDCTSPEERYQQQYNLLQRWIETPHKNFMSKFVV